MKKYCVLFFVAALFCVDLYAEAPPSTPASPVIQPKTPLDEKEYSDAVVVLIDPKAGMIGLSWINDETQEEEKLSFKVDPDKVDVSNALNEAIEFFDIAAGDHVNLVTIKDQSGKEELVEIMDLNAVGSDA